MAYVLSLRPHSPLKRSFSDDPYLKPCSPSKEPFLGPLGDITACNTSACSLYTLGSNSSNVWSRGNENISPLASQSLLNLVPESKSYDFKVQRVEHRPRKRSHGVTRVPPSLSRATAPSNPFSKKKRNLQHVSEFPFGKESSTEDADPDDDNIEESDLIGLYEAIHVPLPDGRFPGNSGNDEKITQKVMPVSLSAEPQPFRRWMSTLRRRHLHRHREPHMSFDGAGEVLVVRSPLSTTSDTMRRNSESMTSSMGFVTAVKTISITIASTSLAPTSERNAQKKLRLGNRSSNTDARRSTESHRGGLGPVIDESAWLRSLQRRKVVEELIASEESYIADLKVLINVTQPLQINRSYQLTWSTGLLHDSYRSSCLAQPYQVIHTTEYSSDLAITRRAHRRTSAGHSTSRLYQ